MKNCKIILSHAGGTLKYLAWRVEKLCTAIFGAFLGEESPKGEEIVKDAKSFYFDVALSGTANVLDTSLKWAPKERILYANDYPYATVEAEWSDAALEEYEMDEGLRGKIYRGNALGLFPGLFGESNEERKGESEGQINGECNKESSGKSKGQSNEESNGKSNEESEK